MTPYPKIESLFKREMGGKMLFGCYSRPEFAYLAGLQWDFDEKIDGTNIRLHWSPEGMLSICGRTDRAQIPEPLLDAILSLMLRDKCQALWPNGEEACLYGEGYGPRIQKGGGSYRDTPGFILFDVRVGHWWLQRDDVAGVAKDLGLDMVPSFGHGTLDTMQRAVGHGLKSHFGDFDAEGLVARPQVPLATRDGHRIITKLKGKDFDR